MMIRAIMLSGMILSATPLASAQVFVIGTGLARECFEDVQSGASSYMRTEEKCSRALREESLSAGNRAATYVNRGVMRMRAGKYDLALSDYSQALESNPDLGAAYLNEGAAHIYQKDFAAALPALNRAYTDFQTALALKPEWDLAIRQLSRFEVTTP